MNFDSLKIDLNDIKGRIIPGVIIFFNLYFLDIFSCESSNCNNIILFLTTNPIFLLVLILFLAYLLGDLNIVISFKLARFIFRSVFLLKKKFLKDYIKNITKKLDFENYDNLEKDYENILFNGVNKYKIDLDNMPEAYMRAKKLEGQINYKLGITIPSLFSGFNCLFNDFYIISVIFFVMAILSYYRYIQLVKHESWFILGKYINRNK
ncbi:MAG: hypothetical protein KAT68_10785 [Bacteroidales bacterium]|nr:hypothetical protein [Bacteroidales bacterium]